MRIGIRTQFIGASVGAILIVAIILTVASTLVLRRTLTSQLAERTAAIAPVVQGELELRRRDLEHLVDRWVTDAGFVNQVHVKDWDQCGKTIEHIREVGKVDVAVLFGSADEDNSAPVSASGIPLSKVGPFVAARARLKLEKGAPQSLIEPINGEIYVIATEQIDNFGLERGELMLCQKLTDAIATDIQHKVNAQVIAFTAAGPTASSMKASLAMSKALAVAFGKLGEKPVTSVGSIQNGETSFITMAYPLPSAPNPRVTDKVIVAGMAYATPETEAATAQRRTLLSSVLIAVGLTALFGVLALALANQIARPIAAMAEQFSRISASGDLSLRVNDSVDNEIGDMARSFNGMQERVEQLHGRVAMAEERMRKELQMASTVQEMLFQQDMPHNAACDVAAYTSTLVETSGDWYAVFDDPDAKRTVFVIADATGHGAAAALLTAITHGFFQTMKTAKQGGDAALSRIPPSSILSMLNQVVLNSAHGTITATVFVGVLHHGTRKMVYASAGHIPPIVTRWQDNEMKANILTCNPSSSIGSADKPVYEDYTVELPADGLLVIYTDGLTEVENPQGLQWGVRKLIGVLRGCQTDTVESVRQKMLDSCMQFARGQELQDDMTYLTIRIK